MEKYPLSHELNKCKSVFTFRLSRGSDSEKYYTLMINPEGESKRKINFEEEGGIGFVGNNDGYLFDTPADGIYDITIVSDNSVVIIYINDNIAYTNRIYGTAKNCWSINSYGGSLRISGLTVSHLAK